MDAERGRSDKIDPGEVAGWIIQLDFFGNALSSANDELIDQMRGCAVKTVCRTGARHRPTPIA